MQRRKRYRRQRVVAAGAVAMLILLVSAVLNLLTATIMEHHANRPTVYEVKYVVSDQYGVQRFESLRG